MKNLLACFRTKDSAKAMMLFYGTTSKAGTKTVHSFIADPHVTHVTSIAVGAQWGRQAPRPMLRDLAVRILRSVAIPAAAERYAEEYADEILASLDSSKQWYLSGDDVRIWLDLRLMGDGADQPSQQLALIH